MGIMHYYQFNIGDYHSHTSHLDEIEDIAFRRMLDWYYLHESPLPDNVEQIARLIRMRSHCESIKNVLHEFFRLTDYGWQHTRAEEEIAAFHAKAEKAKASANARWAKERNANALQAQCEGNAKHKPITNNHKPIDNTSSEESDDAFNKPEIKRIPYAKIAEAYHSTCTTLPTIAKLHESRKAAIKARWLEDEQHQTIEFWQWFFNLVNQSEFLLGNTGNNSFKCSFDWLIKKANFYKVIEGNYSR